MEDTYLQQTTQVDDAGRSRTPTSPPTGAGGLQLGRRGHGMGQVRRHRHRRSDAAHAPPRWTEPFEPLGTWHPQGGRYAAYCVRPAGQRSHAGARRRQVFDTATGTLLRKRRDLVDGDGISITTTSTRAAACSSATPAAGPSSWTPRPFNPGRALRVGRRAHRPDRGREHHDGPRLLRGRPFHELAGAGRRHRRGPVEGDVDLAGSPPSPLRTVRPSRWRGRAARSSPSTPRPETNSGDPPASMPRCSARLLRRRRAAGLRGRRRRGQPLGRLDAGPAGHASTHPTGGTRSRRPRISSATATTWRSLRTTVGLPVGDRPRTRHRLRLPDGRPDLTEEEWGESLPAQPYQSVCPDE